VYWNDGESKIMNVVYIITKNKISGHNTYDNFFN
jgi:hypothetical protein